MAALVAVLALALGAAAGLHPGHAATRVQAGSGGLGSTDDGEGAEESGPRYGPVDHRYSTPAAARETVHSEHARRHGRQPSGPSLAEPGHAATPSEGEAGRVSALALDPAVFGSWQHTSYNLPIRAIHATLLRTGKVLLIAGSGNQQSVFYAGSFKAGLLDPVTGAYTALDPPYDMFCAGHAQLPNGNVLILGGTLAYPTGTQTWRGSDRVYEFDVSAESWTARTRMAHGRWYPSSVQSPAGDVWSFTGKDENGHRNTGVDRYTPSTGLVTPAPAWSLPLYPGLFWTARNRVFYAGSRTGGPAGQPGLYNPGTGAVQPVRGITNLSQRRAAATLFAGDATVQRVLIVGGGWPATTSTSYIDLRASQPAGTAGPHLPTAKAYVGAVNLPTDGSVFQTGGGTGRDTPVYESSNIRGRTVVPLAPNTVPRTYHSSTLLLPDGRIMTLGGDDFGDGFEMRVEVFSPPYLHRGPRPVITAAPTTAHYNTAYTVAATASDATIASAWLIRPNSTTHSVDPNQRAIRLASSVVSGGLRVTTPRRILAPPGYYMLFVNDSAGRPSVAHWVRIK